MTTQSEIRGKVGREVQWVERAITVIYERQTEDEKSADSTSHHNGIGFSATDASIMSSFAKQLSKGKHLSEKQLTIAFRVMPKYARQLFEIAQGKEAAK